MCEYISSQKRQKQFQINYVLGTMAVTFWALFVWDLTLLSSWPVWCNDNSVHLINRNFNCNTLTLSRNIGIDFVPDIFAVPWLFSLIGPWGIWIKFCTYNFQTILVVDGWGISCGSAPIWMSLGFTDDQSTLVHVMDWCCQTTSHFLSQCWPRSLSPYCVTRPQRVKLLFCIYGRPHQTLS